MNSAYTPQTLNLIPDTQEVIQMVLTPPFIHAAPNESLPAGADQSAPSLWMFSGKQKSHWYHHSDQSSEDQLSSESETASSD